MRTTPLQIAIAIVVVLLALAAIGARLGLADRLFGERAPDLAPTGPVCAGLAVGSGEILGIASGGTASELLASAVDRLDLPEDCGGLRLPEDLLPGALIHLRLDPGCRIASIDRLPGPQRLVCGGGIDVNRDGQEDIELLPGIGPSKAGAIVESREADGPFTSIDDLTRVKGIGAKTVERIRPWADPIR